MTNASMKNTFAVLFGLVLALAVTMGAFASVAHAQEWDLGGNDGWDIGSGNDGWDLGGGNDGWDLGGNDGWDIGGGND
ncbi:MAG: hypothetical protein WC829_24160, partial [Hyphomicrobium sp.]